MSRLCDYLHVGLWFKDKRMWAQPAPMILSLLAHTAFSAGAGIAARCVVLVCSCCLLYIFIIRDYGKVFALMSDMRALTAREEWIAMKLDVMVSSLLLFVGSYLVPATCRNVSWDECFSAFVCCFFIMLQLGMMNVSPVN